MYELTLLHFPEAQQALRDIETAAEKAMQSSVLKAAFYLQRAVVFESTGGTVGGHHSQSRSGGIRTATGKLGQSWAVDSFQQGRAWVGRVASGNAYSAILEFGGRILPVVSKYLTLPLTHEAARRGAREMDLFFWESAAGNKFLRSEDDGSFQYLLRDHVNMPAFRYLTVAQRKARDGIGLLLDGVADVAVQRWRAQ